MGKTTCGIATVVSGAASRAELKLSLALLGFTEDGNCDPNEFYTAYTKGNMILRITFSKWKIRGYIIHDVNKRVVYIPSQEGIDRFIHMMLNRLELFESNCYDE